ncbi:MAG: hypothetical protein WCC06_11730 [Candidatus Aminicenantales bacterium]
MKMITLIILLVIISLASNMLYSQSSYVDIVYLKNGRIIRETIIELVPNEKIAIRMSDGSIFVFKMEEIIKIEKSEMKTQPQNNLASSFHNPYKTHKLTSGLGLGFTWLATLIGSAAMGDDFMETTIIPVVGPYITFIRIESDPYAIYLP